MDKYSITELFSQFKARFDQAVVNLQPYTLEANLKEVVALREGYRIETLPKGRAAAPTRFHIFDDIEAMAQFIRRHWPDATKVEIFLRTDGTFQATNCNAWGSDQITCSLAPDLTAQAWAKIWSTPLNQRRAFQELHKLRKTLQDGGKVIVGISQLEVRATGTVRGVLLRFRLIAADDVVLALDDHLWRRRALLEARGTFDHVDLVLLHQELDAVRKLRGHAARAFHDGFQIEGRVIDL